MLATEAEIWCGATDLLPKDRSEISFAHVDARIIEGNVGLLEVHGLVNGDGWARIAIELVRAVESRLSGVVLRVSSRAQIAQGAGAAMLAMEQASRSLLTIAHIESAGALGAALALASCAREITVDADDQPVSGGLNSAAKYGHADDRQQQLTDDIQQTMRFLSSRKRMGLTGLSYPEIMARMVNSELLTRQRAKAVLNHLNNLEGPAR